MSLDWSVNRDRRTYTALPKIDCFVGGKLSVEIVGLFCLVFFLFQFLIMTNFSVGQ